MWTHKHRSLFLVSVLAGLSSVGQSKKEIIAAQGTALDSITRIAEEQHDAILKATDRIQQLTGDLESCNTSLRLERSRIDSVRQASGLAYGKLLRERDSLYVQHRIVSERPQWLSNGLQGFTCVMPFSMRSLPDTLALTFSGSDALTSVITFRIIDWRGMEIHKETVELLKQEELVQDEEKQRLLISLRVQGFFQGKRFHFPPIDAPRDRKHTEDRANGTTYALDDTAWDALRADSHSCSFTYPVNEHESRTIAYSSKLKRVVRLDPFTD